LKLVDEMVDEHSLVLADGVREFDSGGMNYEELKGLVTNKMVQLVMDIYADRNMTDLEKTVSIISSMSYLSMENFVIHVDRLKKGY